MTRPYSMDLRDRAITRILAGESVRSVASALRQSPICAPTRSRSKDVGYSSGSAQAATREGITLDQNHTAHRALRHQCAIGLSLSGAEPDHTPVPRPSFCCRAWRAAPWVTAQDMLMAWTTGRPFARHLVGLTG